MTTICIVRHGETDWNSQKRFQGREDIELNDRGKEQACLVANHLIKSEWDIIISSPLKRALMTAAVIGNHLGLQDLLTCEAFIERDYGKGSGLTLEQQKLAFPDGKIPGKEDDETLKERVIRGLDYITREHSGRRIILVSHGAVINTILKIVSDNTINIGETFIKNTCINIVRYIDHKWKVELYNSVDYLSE